MGGDIKKILTEIKTFWRGGPGGMGPIQLTGAYREGAGHDWVIGYKKVSTKMLACQLCGLKRWPKSADTPTLAKSPSQKKEKKKWGSFVANTREEDLSREGRKSLS